VRDLAATLKVQQGDVVARVETIAEERRRLERELGEAKKKLAMGGGSTGGAEPLRSIGAAKFVGRVVTGIAPKDLKGLVDEAKKGFDRGVAVIVGLGEDGKAGVVAGVSADLTAKVDAVALVRLGAEVMGGKGGGGRPDMAQAGGPDGTKAEAAIEAIAAKIGELLGA
jgi:alanyl-tRNA synthetase